MFIGIIHLQIAHSLRYQIPFSLFVWLVLDCDLGVGPADKLLLHVHGEAPHVVLGLENRVNS